VPGIRIFLALHHVPAEASNGPVVRAQVFEVIVKQALEGAPWRDICANGHAGEQHNTGRSGESGQASGSLRVTLLLELCGNG